MSEGWRMWKATKNVVPFPTGGVRQIREAAKPAPFPVDTEKHPAPEKPSGEVRLAPCDLPPIDLRRDSWGRDF